MNVCLNLKHACDHLNEWSDNITICKAIHLNLSTKMWYLPLNHPWICPFCPYVKLWTWSDKRWVRASNCGNWLAYNSSWHWGPTDRGPKTITKVKLMESKSAFTKVIYFIGNVELLHEPKLQEHPDGDLESVVIRQNHVIEFIAVRYTRNTLGLRNNT